MLNVGDFALANMLRDDAEDGAGNFFGSDRRVIAKGFVNGGQELLLVTFGRTRVAR